MKRRQLILMGAFAAIGTVAMILFGVAFFDEAPSGFERASFTFALLAALFGWLGVILTYLTYRLEAGKVPKPDLWILQHGKQTREWRVPIHLNERQADFTQELEAESQRLLGEIPEPEGFPRGRTPFRFLDPSMLFPTREDIDAYKDGVEKYLETKYAVYLKRKASHAALRARSYVLTLALTNERAGAPAEGVRVRITLPDQEINLRELDDFPEEPDKPQPPEPPKARNRLAFPVSLVSPLAKPVDTTATSFKIPGNVSPPTFRKGSLVVEYEFQEVLHNTQETTKDYPLVLSFRHAGRWTIPYEIHARNLPEPKKGTLVIEAYEKPGEDG